MHEASEDQRETSERSRTKLPITLNYRRLTAGHLSMRRLVRALDVQVVLHGATPQSAFILQDEGEFLIVEAEEETVEEPAAESPEPDPHEDGGEAETLRIELKEARVENLELRQQVERQKTRLKELWCTNCLAEYDEVLTQKDAEIERLKQLLSEAGRRPESQVSESDPHESVSVTTRPGGGPAHTTGRRPRRGKAPPVDPLTGEEPETRLDDWLPSLKRAATWNEWTEEELLLQLAGHLRGHALQEWSLLDEASWKTYETAVENLRARVDPGSRALVAQDFRHTSQGKKELVADFICHLECSIRA